MPGRLSLRALKPHRKRPGFSWPDVASRGIEAARWQVWIGWQLRQWRLSAPDEPNQKQLWVDGFPQSILSKLEQGLRRIELIELGALAHRYGRGQTDIARLLQPPSPEQWTAIRRRRRPDERFADPPRWPPPLSSPPTPNA